MTEYNCPKCKNRGVIYEPKYNGDYKRWEQVAVVCDCGKIRAEYKRRNCSGLKKMMDKYTFENYMAAEPWQQQIAQAACKYVRNPVQWFFIGGQPGCGKTHICTAMANALMKRGMSVRYMIWNEELSALKQKTTDAVVFDSGINSLKKAEVLYIDDFFKSKSVTAADVNITFRILNYRYNEILPTIISSELSIDQIDGIDEALASRIAELTAKNAIYVSTDKSKNYRINPHK